MSALMMPEPRQRYYNNDGTVAAGCYLYTYEAGTSTPKATYQDSAGVTPHANPIVLDAKGEAVIYWSGAYNVDLKTAAGVQITGYPVDNFVSDFLTAEEVQEIIDDAIDPLVINRNGLTNGGMRVALNSAATLTSSFVEGKVNDLYGRVTNVSAGTLTQGNSTDYASNCYAHFSGVSTSAAAVVEAQIRMPSGQAGEYANDACVFSCLVKQDTGASVSYTVTVKTPTTTADDFSALTTISTSSATAVASGADTRITFAIADMAACTKGIAIEVSASLLSSVTSKNFRISEAQFEPGTTRTSFAEMPYEPAEAGIAAIRRAMVIPVRQTVLASSTDSDGLPDFISIGSGLAVDIAAAAVPVVVTASAGMSASGNYGQLGQVDLVGVISADTTISSLTDNATNYLYADISSAGVVTLGKTTVAPVYQWGGTYSTTANQFTFNIQEMTGKVGNGSSAVQTYRVFIGEAVTSGGNVTSVVNYALMGRYRSADAAIALNSDYDVAANIGVIPDQVAAYLVNTSTDKGYPVGAVICVTPANWDSAVSRGVAAWARDRNTLTLSTGSDTMRPPQATGGDAGGLDYTKWNFRFRANRGW